jgi:hypothetical protein
MIYITRQLYIHTRIDYPATVSKTRSYSGGVSRNSNMEVSVLYLSVKKKYDSSDILGLLDRGTLALVYKCHQIWVNPQNQSIPVAQVCSVFPLTLNNVICTKVIQDIYFYKIRFDDTNTLNYSSIQQHQQRQNPKEFLKLLVDKLKELRVVCMNVDTVQDFLNLIKHLSQDVL